MVIEVYLKSGQTIRLTNVNEFEVKKQDNELQGYSITLDPGWTRKLFYVDITQIAALVRVEE